MKYAKRIGFLTGPYVQLASVQEYEQQINKLLNLEQGTIEVKKELIYESGAKTKALVVYAVEDQAKEIDANAYAAEKKQFKYVSFKLTPSSYRFASMQMNKWVNAKARYKTLFHSNKYEMVLKDGAQETLQSCILKQKHNDTSLFLAIENGSGKELNNALVVINPAKKFQARKWIVEEYQSVIYNDERDNLSSINTDEFKSNAKYNKDLKEFLTPVLTQKGIEKIGSFGKSKYKTYASVLGMDVNKNVNKKTDGTKVQGDTKKKKTK